MRMKGVMLGQQLSFCFFVVLASRSSLDETLTFVLSMKGLLFYVSSVSSASVVFFMAAPMRVANLSVGLRYSFMMPSTSACSLIELRLR